ncbi:MAG: fatty acid desaturase family protein [bacterium]|nr:fatty acid desaturase family protein [bacterium]
MSAVTASEPTLERHTAQGNTRWRDSFTREEIRELLAMNDLRSWGSLLLDWGIVIAAMAWVAIWPNPLTILVALVLIGARQLGFAVLMHEASHHSLFSNRRVNDFVGQWLCAYPVWSDTLVYRPYHLGHHARTGTPEDPDIGLVKPFPITRASLRRKIWRDLSGQTGMKFVRGAWKRSFGRMASPEGRRAAVGFAVTNGLMITLLFALGYPLLYLLWAGAFMTTHTLVTRIRAIAEHALTPDADDPLNNTRTTHARWWERLILAPNRVNFHLEHHLLMTVPHYHLPRMHEMLRERGVLDRACIEENGYAAILRRAASRSA